MTTVMNFNDYLLSLSNTTTNGVDFEEGKINWDKLDSKSKGKKSNFKDMASIAFKAFVEGNKESYTKSTQVLHPNLVAYFVENNACKFSNREEIEGDGKDAEELKEMIELFDLAKKNYESKNKNKKFRTKKEDFIKNLNLKDVKPKKTKVYYLVSDSGESIKVSRQIKFGYELYSEIRKYYENMKKIGKKTYINTFLDEKGNLKVKPEKFEYGKRRIDFYFVIKRVDKIVNGELKQDPLVIGIEFLEQDAHKDDVNPEINRSQIERSNIIMSNNKCVKHLSHVWEELWNRDDEYRQYRIQELDRLLSIYFSEARKEDFAVDFLKHYISSDENMCRSFVQAYNSPKEYKILINDDFFDINGFKKGVSLKKSKNKKYKGYDGITEELKKECKSQFKSDLKLYEDNLLSEKPVKYFEGRGGLRLNSEGFYALAAMTYERKYLFETIEDHKSFSRLFNRVAKAAIDALNHICNLNKQLIEGDMYQNFGLNHKLWDIENPEFYKDELDYDFNTDEEESDDDEEDEEDDDETEESSGNESGSEEGEDKEEDKEEHEDDESDDEVEKLGNELKTKANIKSEEDNDNFFKK